MSICTSASNPKATMAPWQNPKSPNEEYPVPIQCISRRRHHQSLSWSVDEFIIAASSVEPIKFGDDVDASKLFARTNNKKSRHRRSCSASTSAPGSNKNFRTLPPLYVPYVPPSTSADRARDLPPIETPLHKKKKTTSPLLDCVVTTDTTNHQSLLLSNQTKQCMDNDEEDKSNQVPVMQTSATVASASGSSSRLPESFSADSQTGHDTPGNQYDNSPNAFAKSLVERTVTSDSTMTIMTNPTDESRSPCTSIASFVGSGRCGPTTSTSSCSIREEEEEHQLQQGGHNANNFSTRSGTSTRRSMTDTTRSSCRSIRFFKLLNEKAKANSITSTSSTMATSCSTTRRLSADINNTNNNNKNNTSATGNHNPVQSLVQGVVHAVENVQEQHRKAQCRKRISQTLLTLRAATLIHYQQEQERINNNKEKQGEDQTSSVSSSSEEEKDYYHDYYDHGENYDERDNHNVDLRDLGSVLFCPLDQRVLARNNHHHHRHRRHSGKDKDKDNNRENNVKNDGNSIVVEKFPVVILPEPNMSENPLLLTQEMFQQLMDEGVPECLHMHAWQRIFSIGRDGDSFLTLLDHCAPYQHTILVLQTTTGHLFGGFVSDPWQEQEGYSLKHSYYGTGMSFLFANHPYYPPGSEAQDDNKDSSSSAKKKTTSPLTIFPWTGSNDFCQICDMDKNILAMGGSGAFGFILEDDFYKGSTDHCGTFGNPPLTPDKDGIFTVAAMEIYGLVPFGLLGPNHVCSHSVVDPKLNPQSLIVHNAKLGGFY